MVVNMKLLTKHVGRATVLACTWENDIKFGTMWKVNRMYSRICYRFVFPEKRSGVINHLIT